MKKIIIGLAAVVMAAGQTAWAQDTNDAASISQQMEQMKAQLEELQQKLNTLDAVVTDPEGKVETALSDLSKVKKVTVSGYAQIRYEAADQKEDGGKFDDGYNLRRARIKVTATPTQTTSAVLQLDMGGNKLSVKDAYLTYAPKPIYPFTIGQMNWIFGYEIPYSSSRRETPERALVFRRLFQGERDRGAKLGFPVGKYGTGQVGAFDGTGIESGIAGDFDSKKDYLANVSWAKGDMEWGISGYLGGNILNSGRTDTVTADKDRYGADFRYYGENWTFKSEYVRGKGVDTADPAYTNWIDGYYTQFNYNTNVQNTLVARYSSMSEDPKKLTLGRRSAWDLGWIHYFDNNLKMKIFQTINQESKVKLPNDITRLEFVVTY